MNRNVYEKMNPRLLRLTLRRNLPVFDGVSSGFYVEHSDSDHAIVIWKNAGTDETLHRDMMSRAVGVLKRNGYEVRQTKPANTTLILRRVKPIVTHLPENQMGLFEAMVETVYDLAVEISEELTRRIDERYYLP